jgi:hypothetical protein
LAQARKDAAEAAYEAAQAELDSNRLKQESALKEAKESLGFSSVYSSNVNKAE